MTSLSLAKQFTTAEEPVTRSHQLTATLIDTDAGFRALQPEWHELQSASSDNTFFLTWEWLYTWWTHLGSDRKLHIIAVRDGERLVALAPLALRAGQWKRMLPFRVVEFLGTGNVGSDYLSFIVRKTKEESAVRVLADYLTKSNLALEFAYVERHSASVNAIVQQLRQLGWHNECTPIESSPYIKLEGLTWESYLATLGRTRVNFTKKLKKLNSLYKLRVESAATDAERLAAFDILLELHLKRRSEVGGSNALHTSELQDFHKEFTARALQCKTLQLHIMYLDDEPAAAMYAFEHDKVFYFYQAGFDMKFATYSVGLVMIGLMVKGALERGNREFDFLHGEEPYKFQWANAARELVRFQCFPPDARGWLLVNWVQARRAMIRLGTKLRPAEHAARPVHDKRPAPGASTSNGKDAGKDTESEAD
jgi:CelD/BcsL family acetyltransferase involved in cellulose biosynthesis